VTAPAAGRRVLGIDPGSVRVGLALSDPSRTIATPLDSLEAGEDLPDRVLAAAREHGCETVVVGLPRGMSGRDTASTVVARRLADALRGHGLAVELWDERLTSAEAERLLLAAGRRRAQRKTERDPIAATLILQGWLDATRASGDMENNRGPGT
jgi:putative holliday junction resolvase